jgi:hypothetical protein
MRINTVLVLARSLTSGRGLSVGALASTRGEERFSAPGSSCFLVMGFSPGAGLPTAKADCEFAFFRWTKVQLPLLKQGAPS